MSRAPGTAGLEGGLPDRTPRTAIPAEAVSLLSGALPVADVLQRLAELFRARLSVDAAQVWLRQGASGDFHLVAEAGPKSPWALDPGRVMSRLAQRIAAQAGAMVVMDAAGGLEGQGDEVAAAASLGSVLGVSVLDPETPGAVILLTRQFRAFQADEVALAQALGTTTTIAVQNARLRDEQVQRADQAQWLADIARTVNCAHSVKSALAQVCQKAALLCAADVGTIWIWDQSASRLVPAMSQRADGTRDEVRTSRLKNLRGKLDSRERGLIRTVIETRQPVQVDDAAASPLVDPMWVELFQIRSVIGVPLIVNDRVIGALILQRPEVRPFTPAQAQLALAIAEQVAFAVNRAQLLEDTEKRLRQTEAHLEIARTLSSTLELKPLLAQVAQQAARAAGMDRCSINLWKDGRFVPMTSQFADGRKEPSLWDAYRRLEHTLVEDVPCFVEMSRDRAPVVIQKPQEDPRVPEVIRGFNTKVLLLVPLIRQDKVVGAMGLSNTDRDDPVTTAQVGLATTMASQVSLALDNARLHAETERRLRQTGALLRVAEALGGSLDTREIARRASREVTRLLGADTSVFFGEDESGTHLAGIAGYHVPAPLLIPDYRMPMNHKPDYLREAEETGRPVASGDVARDPRFDHPVIRTMPIAPAAVLCAPVLSQGQLLGALLSYWWSGPRAFTEEEVQLAAGVAAQMAPVLENARLYGQAQRALGELTVTQERLVQSEKLLRSQRVESIGTLAGGIAHDLNNVLAPILAGAQLLRRRTTDVKNRRMLDSIEASALRGAEMVRQVLAFGRGMEGQRVALQMSHLAREVEHITRQTFPRSIEIRVQAPPDLWSVKGDTTQLHQVLLNLCVNARDAMLKGGRLTLALDNVVLDQSYAGMNPEAQPGRYVVLSVSDTGTGMAPQVRDRIFEPFFTTKDLGKGTGLGLSTVQAIVKSHGGFMSVHSEPGQGTEFKVYLPAVEGAAEEGVAPDRQEPPAGKGQTILVVDDEAAVRDILTATLETYGYAPLAAADGAEAVAMFADNRSLVACVVTDLMMPVMDGLPTVRAIRRISPAVKIIAMTGLPSEATRREVTMEGVSALLQKPFTADTLLRALDTVLARS